MKVGPLKDQVEEKEPFVFLENDEDRQPFELANNQQWLEEDEGQLSVDVYQNQDSIVIKSTIAGVKPENLDISVSGDMVTIRGKREQATEVEEKEYYYQECYWGSFSRSIILPCEVNTEKVQANLKNGILTIILPKAVNSRSVNVPVEEDDEGEE
ncbi:MAG: Hsp20/alpha crystallin family protein [bacterium]